ncbi:recombinase family protein [Verrucomicrobiota bacterium]
MKQKQKRVAVYARVSSGDGRQSVEGQLVTLRQYCSQRGFRIHKEYCDEMSGARDDRPQFQALMDACRKRTVDSVLTFRFDRLSRSTKTLIEALEEFRELGIDFISYSENIDTSTPIGKCMYTVISAFSAMEREICRERIINGLRNTDKKLGAPRKQFDTARAIELKNQGWGCRRIGKALGVSYGTIYNYLKTVKKSSPQESPISVNQGDCLTAS